MFGKGDDTKLAGMLHPVVPKALAGLPPEGDLAYARAAASEVLTRGGKDASAPWENPSTGARGTVTPVATAYRQDGTTCREFLASYERDGSSSWLQGEACRAKGGWEVKNLKPWQRT
jgi:surface antigen